MRVLNPTNVENTSANLNKAVIIFLAGRQCLANCYHFDFRHLFNPIQINTFLIKAALMLTKQGQVYTVGIVAAGFDRVILNNWDTHPFEIPNLSEDPLLPRNLLCGERDMSEALETIIDILRINAVRAHPKRDKGTLATRLTLFKPRFSDSGVVNI